MSEKVQSFNPFLVLIWILQLIILGIDYEPDRSISWSIPIIGSFLVIQIYMIWKTNYDEMVEEQQANMIANRGGTMSPPTIRPGITNLQEANSTKNSMIQLNLSPSVTDEKEEKN